MIPAFFLLSLLIAHTWLAWSLGGWFGVGVLALLIPISCFLTLGWSLALGLVGMVFWKHDDYGKWKRFLKYFLSSWAWLLIILWFLPWWVFWLIKSTNEWTPATLPRITISNGEKTVIFQSMMHIASPGFYEDIKQDMQWLVWEDYVFFYEGVSRGTDESIQKLGTLLGTDIDPKMYTLFASIADLSFQGDEIYTNILPSINVDISTDALVSLAEGKNIAPPKEQIDILAWIENNYPLFSPLEKMLAREISRGMLNLFLRTYTSPGLQNELKKNTPFFEIILDERNAIIVETIKNSPNQKIYMHYGAMHFQGVMAGLQAYDQRWREIDRREYRVIR